MPSFAGALRAAYGAALALPIEAVLLAGVFDVRTGAVTTFLSTDDVNVEGNSEDAAAVLDALLNGGVAPAGSGGRRRARALQAAPAQPNALSIVGLAPHRNATSAGVALYFNALAPCAPPCSDAQITAASIALRLRVLATGANASLLAGVLPPGVGWALNDRAVVAFALPRVRIRWRLWAWLASLPAWIVAVSASLSSLACCAALAVLWLRRRRARAQKVAPEELALQRAGSEGGARLAKYAAAPAAGTAGSVADEPVGWEETAPTDRGASLPGSNPHTRKAEGIPSWDDEFAAHARRAPLRRGPRGPPPLPPQPISLDALHGRGSFSPHRAAGAASLRGLALPPPAACAAAAASRRPALALPRQSPAWQHARVLADSAAAAARLAQEALAEALAEADAEESGEEEEDAKKDVEEEKDEDENEEEEEEELVEVPSQKEDTPLALPRFPSGPISSGTVLRARLSAAGALKLLKKRLQQHDEKAE